MKITRNCTPRKRTGLIVASLLAIAANVFSPDAQASHAGVSRVEGEEGIHGHVAPRFMNGITPMATSAHLVYYGGKVIPNVKVYQVLWGDPSTHSYIAEVSGTQMGNFYAAITNSPYMDWLSEYNTVGLNGQDGQPGSNQTIGRGTFNGKIIITPSVTATSITDAQIQSEISSQIGKGVLPPPDFNTIYMINFPAGMTITQGGSNSCQAGGFCAYHGTLTYNGASVYYGVLPDMSASSGCASGCGTSTTFNNQTSVASHELIEAITDAEVGIGTTVSRPLAWYDSTNGEIGDICNAQQGSVAGYTVQKEWSNKYGACILTAPTATNDFSISVSPASASVTAGSSVTFTVATALTSGSAQSITLSISGLPSGVTGSFSPASVNSGSSSTLTLTAASTAAAATATFTVTGTGSSATHTATGSLTVVASGSTYPESAHPYANNFDYTWSYTKPGNPTSIAVTFDAQTKVEANYDYIYIMDKNGTNIAGSPFTSTTLAGATKTITGDTVKIRLKTDTSVTYWGFKVTNVTGGAADTTAPTVSITAPTAGSTLTGSTVVSASASDNVAVTKVEFYLDGALQSTTSTSPYQWTWAPTSAQNGSHSLTAKAYDAANNVGTSAAVSVTVNISTGTCTPAQLITNTGFESGATGWTASPSGDITNSTTYTAHAGSYYTWLNGNGTTSNETLYQTVTIPACTTTATLKFWMRIVTAETGSTVYDTIAIQVRNTSGAVLSTLGTYSNVNATASYVQYTFDLSAYKGQTVRIFFNGNEDSAYATSYLIDDVTLNVQ